MAQWYGLKEDGEIIAVMRWNGFGRPTTFDFGVMLHGRCLYDVVPVAIEEIPE